MDYNYIVFIYFTTIVFPALLMACFYGYIYHIVLIKIRQKGTLAPGGARRQSEASRSGSLNSDVRDSTQMMRVIVSEKRREGKAAKKLSIIVLFFMICWMPLYTINCVQAFCPTCMVPLEVVNFTIILSHANSAMNPFLYAYHLKEFRMAMRNALYSLASRLTCGKVKDTVRKEVSVSVSRTFTMPSMAANASLAAKSSSKFRRVGYSEEERYSPNGHNLIVSTPSRDTLLRPIASDKSISAMSFQGQPEGMMCLAGSPEGDQRVLVAKEAEDDAIVVRLCSEEIDVEEITLQWTLSPPEEE